MTSQDNIAMNASAIMPVRRFKLSDTVAAQIAQLIASGHYAEGDKLPSERVIAEEFGIGRSSIREALRLLEARGVLRIVHGVGVFVSSGEEREKGTHATAQLLLLDDCTVPELFEVRLALECDAAALAAKRATAADVARMTAIVEAAVEEGISDDAYVERDAELHLSIVQATRNRLFIKIYGSIQPLFVAYSKQVIEIPGRRAASHAGHLDIIEAIAAGKSAAARAAMKNHLHAVEREIAELLKPAPQGDAAAE